MTGSTVARLHSSHLSRGIMRLHQAMAQCGGLNRRHSNSDNDEQMREMIGVMPGALIESRAP
ncbi:hypothetical protein [Bradyrhizobium sp. 33ap4]|uniref:hypothetical protein n=1 Tax=Bradyrhizobium sp. 33ap4 TaxID=3061630 RepID=UPI00292D2B29|nr:hypothetical protein [Bradyrhizobium sp. 33ap4]